MASKADVERYKANLQSEIDGAATYRAVAAAEAQPERAEIFRRLAAVEESHAEFWRGKLVEAGATAGTIRPSLRARLMILIARRFGPESVIPTLRTLEQIDRGQYDDQPESKDTILPAQERSHARVLSRLTGPARSDWDGAFYSTLEGRHGAGGGNALRAAVLGINDGLVSNTSLVMGVAGAAFSQHTVFLTGLAGLLAGACSMALGEWLSVQNSRELYQKQIATERDELIQVPDEEKEELVLIYQSKGMDRATAQATAERVMANKDVALDTLAREELGVNPEDLGGSAWAAAVSSFAVFTIGAVVPVVPFLFLGDTVAVGASLALAALALFASGAATSLFTGRGALFSGFRQAAIGIGAALLTYAVGSWLGVSAS